MTSASPRLSDVLPAGSGGQLAGATWQVVVHPIAQHRVLFLHAHHHL